MSAETKQHIEITPGMVEAGIAALCFADDENQTHRPIDALSLIVSEVYEAMERSRPKTSATKHGHRTQVERSPREQF